MPLADWIDKYPQVKALLQEQNDALLYGTEDEPEVSPPLTDEEYRTQIRALMAEIRACEMEAAYTPETAQEVEPGRPQRVMSPETVRRLAHAEAEALSRAMARFREQYEGPMAHGRALLLVAASRRPVSDRGLPSPPNEDLDA